jgi:hypothetical protein
MNFAVALNKGRETPCPRKSKQLDEGTIIREASVYNSMHGASSILIILCRSNIPDYTEHSECRAVGFVFQCHHLHNDKLVVREMNDTQPVAE